MINMAEMFDLMRQIADLGGPVILILIAASIYVLAVTLYKLWQFRIAGVGRHKALKDAVAAWDTGDRSAAVAHLQRSKSYLSPVVEMAFGATRDDSNRLVSEAEARFARVERGRRTLENIAQLAPLLGLAPKTGVASEEILSIRAADFLLDHDPSGGNWIRMNKPAGGGGGGGGRGGRRRRRG